MENFIESVLAETVTEVSKSTVGWTLEEAEVAKEAESGFVAQSRSKLALGTDLTRRIKS